MNILLKLFKLFIFVLISTMIISCGSSDKEKEEESSNIALNIEYNAMEIFKIYAIRDGQGDAPRVSDYHDIGINNINQNNLDTANILIAGAEEESVLTPMKIQVLLYESGMFNTLMPTSSPSTSTPTPMPMPSTATSPSTPIPIAMPSTAASPTLTPSTTASPTPTPSTTSLNQEVTYGKWVKPSESVCEDNGGRYVNNECESSWHNAKVICSVGGDTLPMIRTLKEVIVDCERTLSDDNTTYNKSYQTCYREQGFTLNYYWSATTVSSNMSHAWIFYFLDDNVSWINKTREMRIRCIREESSLSPQPIAATPLPTPTAVTEEVNHSKWIKPSQSICERNGGIYTNNGCTSNWEKSKEICSANGNSLPTIESLKAVVTDCREASEAYTDCYEEKGFTSSSMYWSSTTSESSLSYAWIIEFSSGNDGWSDKSDEYHVQCLKEE